MLLKSLQLVFLVALAVSAGALSVSAQSADGRSPLIGQPPEEERPKTFRETMEKLRIEKEKKEYGQMLERGEEALKISEDLERAYAINGRLTTREMDQLETVEKLVKKIRSELGGDDDDDDKDKNHVSQPMPPPAEAVKSFRATTVKLFDELKKTSRFTISTAAIQTSNAVIKLARFLRIAK